MTKVMPQLILVANHKIQTGRKAWSELSAVPLTMQCIYPVQKTYPLLQSTSEFFLKVPADAAFMQKFNTMLKTTKRNFIKETAL